MPPVRRVVSMERAALRLSIVRLPKRVRVFSISRSMAGFSIRLTRKSKG